MRAEVDCPEVEADLVEGVEEAEAGVHHLQPAGLVGREVVDHH